MKFVDERLIIYNSDKSLENKPNCSARALSTAYNKKITNLFKYSVSPWMKKEDVFTDINNDCEEFINSIVLE